MNKYPECPVITLTDLPPVAYSTLVRDSSGTLTRIEQTIPEVPADVTMIGFNLQRFEAENGGKVSSVKTEYDQVDGGAMELVVHCPASRAPRVHPAIARDPTYVPHSVSVRQHIGTLKGRFCSTTTYHDTDKAVAAANELFGVPAQRSRSELALMAAARVTANTIG